MKTTITIDTNPLELPELQAVARHGAQIALGAHSVAGLEAAGALIDQWVREGRAIYGVTTGFGAMSDVTISSTDTDQLQENVLMSHAAGVGPLFDESVVRAIMLLRIRELALGHSCARNATVQQLIRLLNAGIHPAIPEQGSVGASGDLCPLAHMALVLIGKGEAFLNGERLPGAEALEALQPSSDPPAVG
jgi:histidine ammonia-lyase